ncbi:MAG: hypothetical protein JSV33_05960 [bacterium]|nr:MAG: hypothetical protein JSV33_05960 [bacterium]
MAILKIIASIFLLIALGRLPYKYYIALRWIVLTVSAVSAFEAFSNDKAGWAWLFVAIAVFFNPIYPIYLTRSIWAPIDIAAAIIFLASIGAMKSK